MKTNTVEIPLDHNGAPDITPNMKALCKGEFFVEQERMDEDGNEYLKKVMIDWTSIKEIYKKMAKIAVMDLNAK